MTPLHLVLKNVVSRQVTFSIWLHYADGYILKSLKSNGLCSQLILQLVTRYGSTHEAAFYMTLQA